MKKIITIFFILTLCALGGAVYLVKNYDFDVLPLSYSLKNFTPLKSNQAGNSQVLIMGDDLGKELNKYKKEILSEINKATVNEISIFNWSSSNEGIHRSLYKLQSLKKVPPFIIYQGGNSDFYEAKFYPREMIKLFENFKTYKDVNKASVMATFPWAGLYYYKFIQKLKLGPAPKPNGYSIPPRYIPNYLKTSYELYKIELEELIKIAKINNSTLMLVTTPINLEIEPKTVCKQTTSNDLNHYLDDLEEDLKNSKASDVLNKVSELEKTALSNPRVLYLKGMALKDLGRLRQAQETLNKVSAFDCRLWRNTSVHNAIMRDLAAKYNIILVDFDKFVNRNLGVNETFLNDTFPQYLFYENFAELLGKRLKRIMRLR